MLDRAQLVPTARETLDGVLVVVEAVYNGVAGCRDAVPQCGAWLATRPQLCRDTWVTMQRDCRRSCGFCGGDEQPAGRKAAAAAAARIRVLR